MKAKELSGEQLDYWVAKAKQIHITPASDGQGFRYNPHPNIASRRWAPSHFWSQGGPIIEEAKIDLNWDWEESREWTASMEPDINSQGTSVLEAAMRAFVVSHFGEEVD